MKSEVWDTTTATSTGTSLTATSSSTTTDCVEKSCCPIGLESILKGSGYVSCLSKNVKFGPFVQNRAPVAGYNTDQHHDNVQQKLGCTSSRLKASIKVHWNIEIIECFLSGKDWAGVRTYENSGTQSMPWWWNMSYFSTTTSVSATITSMTRTSSTSSTGTSSTVTSITETTTTEPWPRTSSTTSTETATLTNTTLATSTTTSTSSITSSTSATWET